MRKSASDIVNDLKLRLARLEKAGFGSWTREKEIEETTELLRIINQVLKAVIKVEQAKETLDAFTNNSGLDNHLLNLIGYKAQYNYYDAMNGLDEFYGKSSQLIRDLDALKKDTTKRLRDAKSGKVQFSGDL